MQRRDCRQVKQRLFGNSKTTTDSCSRTCSRNLQRVRLHTDTDGHLYRNSTTRTRTRTTPGTIYAKYTSPPPIGTFKDSTKSQHDNNWLTHKTHTASTSQDPKNHTSHRLQWQRNHWVTHTHTLSFATNVTEADKATARQELDKAKRQYKKIKRPTTIQQDQYKSLRMSIVQSLRSN